MMRAILSMVMATGLVVTAAGCGGGDGGGTTGSSAETMASCTAYCNAYVAKNCGEAAIYTDLNDCLTNDCGVIKDIPARCQAKMKAYYVCRTAQSDLCGDSGCGAELSTAGTCM